MQHLEDKKRRKQGKGLGGLEREGVMRVMVPLTAEGQKWEKTTEEIKK